MQDVSVILCTVPNVLITILFSFDLFHFDLLRKSVGAKCFNYVM